MRRAEIIEYGDPAKVVRCADVPDVGDPDDGEIVFEVLATPINPADLAFCAGNYRLKTPLSAVPGPKRSVASRLWIESISPVPWRPRHQSRSGELGAAAAPRR